MRFSVSKPAIALCCFLCLFLIRLSAQTPIINIDGRTIRNGDTIKACVNQELNFRHTSNSVINIQWYLNTGTPPSNNTVGPFTSRFSTAGVKEIKQIVQSGSSFDSAIIYIEVSSVLPVPSFNFIPNNECGNIPVAFTNTTTATDIVGYRWDFGDNSFATTKDVSHSFLTAIGTPGTQNFNVALQATNEYGCTGTLSKQVQVKKVPDASLRNVDAAVQESTFNGITTFKSCTNNSSYVFKFSNGSTTAADIITYNIDWGDGSDTSFASWPAGIVIEHPFPRGNKLVTITATGRDGCIGIRKYNVFLGTTPAGGVSSPGNTAICAPDDLTFFLNNVSSNPPGTQYRLTFNDGTPQLLFQHPAPDSIIHRFLRSSCATSSDSYTNSFSLKMVIENPCGTTTGSVIPITVSSKPKARISVSPDTVVCAGNTVTISNASEQGGQVTYDNGNYACNSSSTLVWNLFPATGWTIQGGSTGSKNNNNNPLTWTPGTSNLQIRFNTPGVYELTLYNANGCGVDSTVSKICVQLPPVAAFTMDRKQDCEQGVANFTNTTSPGACTGNEYSWSVDYIDNSGCGVSGTNYNFINNTNAFSENPSIQFNNPGLYIIRLTARVNRGNSACTPTSFTDTFLVKGKPKVTLPRLPVICLNNTISPTATVSDCYATGNATYAWTFTNGSSGTSILKTPDPVLYTSAGTHPVRLEVSNECGTSVVNTSVTVTSLPLVNAGNDQTICSGVSTSIGSTPAPGLTYEWSPLNGIVSPGAALTDLNLTYSGDDADTTYTYVLKASAGQNCFNFDTVRVTVSKTPSLTIAPSSAAICPGESAILVASGAESYSWSPALGLNNTTGDTVIATPLSTTTYTVSGRFGSGTCNGSSSAIITVKPFPSSNAGSDTIVCIEAIAVQLGGSPPSGIWTGTEISAGGIFNPSAAGQGLFKQYYTVAENGCSKTDSMLVTVIQQPVANAGADTTVCTGLQSFQLNASPAGGQWSGNAQVRADGLFTPTIAGTYTLTYTYGSGTCVDTDQVTVTVEPGITNNVISADQSICIGNTAALLSGSLPSGGDGNFTYQWQRSSDNVNWTNIAAAITKDYSPGIPDTTVWYRRIVTTTRCAGDISSSVKLTVRNNALAELQNLQAIGCVPFRIDESILLATNDTSRNGSYHWFVDGILYDTSTSGEFNPYTIAQPNDTIDIMLIVKSAWGCIDDTAFTRFYTFENPQPAFTQNIISGCGPLVVSFRNTTPSVERFDFLWDFGNGRTSTDKQPAEIVFESHPLQADTTYTITLYTFNGCDTIKALGLVTVKSKPKALFAPDKSEGCSPMKVRFSNTSRGFGNSYLWDFGDGSPILNSNDPFVEHTFNVGIKDTFFVKLVAANDCGADTLTYAIVVNPNTIKLDFAFNGNERVGCLPHTVRFINNSSGANLYSWDFGDGTIVSTTRGIDTITHVYTRAGDFTVTVLATNNCSDTSDKEMITVQPIPAVDFSILSSNACSSDTIRFLNQSETGINYLWIFGDGTRSANYNVSKVYTLPGTYEVTLVGSKLMAQGNTCSDTSKRALIIGGATGSFEYSGGYSCIGTASRFEAKSVNASEYLFVFGDGDSLRTSNAVVFHEYRNPGAYLPSLYLLSGNCRRQIVNGDSIRIDRLSAGIRVEQFKTCGTTLVRFTDTSRSYFGISRYEWDFGDGTYSSQQFPQKNYQQTASYNIRLVITGISGCTDTSFFRLNVLVNNYPESDIDLVTSTCTNYLIEPKALVVSNDPIDSFEWSFGNGATATGENAQVRYSRAGNYTIRLIGRTQAGCSDTAYREIRVDGSPIVQASADARICKGNQTILSVSGATRYSWSPQPGLSCIDCNQVIANPEQSTTYLVQGTNNAGCTSVDSIRVQVVQPFTVQITGRDSICIGQSTQLIATGADRYEWSPAIGLSSVNVADPVASPRFSVPYRVIGYDQYNCFSDTTAFVLGVGEYPTVDLGSGTTLVAGTPVRMSPVITNGPVMNYNWTPLTSLSCENCAGPIATINNDISYKLEVENIYGCKGSDTIQYKVFCAYSQLFIANAFSPDGDGINDKLVVRGKGISKVNYFRVFNRWGQLVFEKNNIGVNDTGQGWDGTINGRPAQPDVYVYTASVNCTAGSSFVYKGNVTLVR